MTLREDQAEAATDPAAGTSARLKRARTGLANGGRASMRATARGGRAGIRAAASGTRAGTTKFRSYVASEGADATGLSRLTEMHIFAAAGDAAVTVSLAGTIFAMPTGQARSQVALFLLMTMAPFAVLAPLVGPILDRFRHGRRWAIGATLATRAFLAWVLAGLVTGTSSWLFPVALGILVMSRAYAVARAAAVPRVLPATMSLVRANSRISIAGLLGMSVGGLMAGVVARIGPSWSLRFAFAIFVLATILAIRLPASIDSEPAPPRRPRAEARRAPLARLQLAWAAVPAPVKFGLAIDGGSRMLSGFMILFITFLVRGHPVGTWTGPIVLALVAAAAGIGNAAGSLLGNRMHVSRPEGTLSVLMLVAIAATSAAAIWWHAVTALLLGLIAGLFAQLGRLCLDAIVQRDVAESGRATVFSWNETILQLCWVFGGALGILIPLRPSLGFGSTAALLALFLAAGIFVQRRHARAALPSSPHPPSC
ncbi:MAG: MFS transporter [Nostocoides sp.]